VRAALLFALLSAIAAPAPAQRVQPEVRFDLVGPRPYSPQAGVGGSVAAGVYTRLSAAVGWGPRRSTGVSVDGGEYRGDFTARVTLDPYRQQRWALAFGGGVSLRRHAYLAVLVDLEGPERFGWLPVIQAGVAGGARAGVILRRAVPGRR
jgi:hypothetical protein